MKTLIMNRKYLVSISVLVLIVVTITAEAQDYIQGPWLWMIAPGSDIDTDYLAIESDGAITETQVAQNGVNEGDILGELQWSSGRIYPTYRCGWFLCESNNVQHVVNAIALSSDRNLSHYTAYALINIVSPRDQNNVQMGVGSDDAVKIWLNGIVVHRNNVDRGTSGIQDRFTANLKAGNNFLLVKVCENFGNWGLFFKIYLDSKDFTTAIPTGSIVNVAADTVIIAPEVTDLSIRHVATVAWDTDSVSNIHSFADGALIGGTVSNRIYLWNPHSEQLQATLTYDALIRDIAVSPDEGILASGSMDGTIQLWDLQTETLQAILRGPTNGGILSVTISPDGGILASGSADGIIQLWDLQTETLQTAIRADTNGGILSVVFSPDGSMLASGGVDGTIRVWNPQTLALETAIKAHTDSVMSIAFNPHNSQLASGGADGTIELWDSDTGRHQATLNHELPILSIAFNPDGSRLASGSVGGTALLWDPRTRKIQATLGHRSPVRCVVFSPDGSMIISGSQDGKTRQWRITTGAEIEPALEADVNGDEGVDVQTEPTLAADVNGDGTVDLQDLAIVNARLGQTGENTADVNGDGIVNVADLALVANAIEDDAAAPSLQPQVLELFTAADVKRSLSAAQHLDLTDTTSQRGIIFLQQLLIALTPKETTLLANYPNPFNPETWIPYHLSKDAEVTLHIYALNGQLVRTLTLGHQPAGMYQNRSRAAYWDGKNTFGESVASGVYFYRLTAGGFTATRKMLIRK
ncbi:MAG: dockerin type I domain-containing protein [Candidatus Poribacteria bacterium]|nr:dockerin type I domain-containing protein [Candidatus Poribacteria bacterium]